VCIGTCSGMATRNEERKRGWIWVKLPSLFLMSGMEDNRRLDRQSPEMRLELLSSQDRRGMMKQSMENEWWGWQKAKDSVPWGDIKVFDREKIKTELGDTVKEYDGRSYLILPQFLPCHGCPLSTLWGDDSLGLKPGWPEI